jgi:hypothetical protein
VFILFRLMFMMFWLPVRLLMIVISRATRPHHHRRLRVTWLPGQAGLARWTRRVTRQPSRARRTPAQQYVITPLTMLAVAGAGMMLIYAWLVWWMLLMVALPVALLA